MTFLEITQRQFWFMGPCFKSYLSYKFDQSETIHEEFGQSSCLDTLQKSFQALIFLKLSADHLIIYNCIMSSGFFKFCHRGYNRVILLSYVLFAPNNYNNGIRALTDCPFVTLCKKQLERTVLKELQLAKLNDYIF